ncbi:PAS domain S-box-containing protein/diguanylate cyclase (GGDEF)-like protein [Alteromonadaceae bacterium 2753L.S.0a.02]|nr:PAS domain S-box-containing protein/diguanylate cyclase (GGDEF)-like protein [Alteromonadaceae bacterium 2753L.S.0a.02]
MQQNAIQNESNLRIKHSKILVVDDLCENHRVFNNILGDLDAQIYSANSGEDAISLILRHQFAVILLDVMMPGMDGFETAHLIRINEETKFTPIIFITAMEPNEEYESRGYEMGAVDYLFKPIKPQALVGKVKVFLELEHQRYRIKQTLDDIQRLENRNELLLKSVGEGILGLDQIGKITFSNPAAQELLGYTERELERRSILDVMCLSSTENATLTWEHTEVYKRCIKGLGLHEHIGVFWDKNKSPFPVEYLATPIRDGHDNAFIGVVIAFQDVTERKKTEDRLAQLAQIDTLTGLYNRYAFGKQLSQSLARGERSTNKLALLFVDLDKFKQVNDNLGHEAGDLLLKACADRLQNCVREGDILSRIGGDEFTVILEAIDNGRSAAIVAKKINNELSKPFEVWGNEIYISASIGIATFPESAKSSDALLRCSDIAMYKAKESGRNSFQFFTSEMQNEVSSELALENALRLAAQNNEFSLHYQPKLDPSTGETVGVEALLRWQKKNGEFIPPDIFIRKAEEMGLIQSIGEWVLIKGCEQMHAWQQQGFFKNGHTIAINLSMRQLVCADLISTVANILEQSQLPAHNLELEITESMMMKDPETTIDTLNGLHRLGVKLTIDDFGTGYSSLSHLRQLPIDCLKIDKSFVQALDQPNGEAIVKAIIGLGRNLDLKIVAEGAETEAQVNFLKAHNIDLIQGYYYSRPIPAPLITKYLTQRNT